jgi:hypothetical protein
MKTSYCNNQTCSEKCLPVWYSVLCVGIGSLLTSSLTAYRVLKSLKYLPADLHSFDFLWMPILAILVMVILTIILSLTDRFIHPLTALVFGTSFPSFLYGLASLGVPYQ